MTTKTTPNVPLLQRTLARIETHPETWYQESYRCASGMCFAGWAVELDGGQWRNPDPGGPGRDDVLARDDDPDDDVWELRDGTRVVDACDRATRVLGLDPEQAEQLFFPHNTLNEIRGMVRDLCGEATP